MADTDSLPLVTFALISAGFIVTPGPNVIVIVSTSLQAGVRRGLQTVMGTGLAMALQMLIAAVGTASLLSVLSDGLLWLKWAGVIYLTYLGISYLLRGLRATTPPEISALGSFQRGFWISLTNPKTILFFSAFLPQFISGSENYLQQLTLLSLIFWTLAMLLDSGYALLAHQVRGLLRGRFTARAVNGATGTIYLMASALLAGSRQH